MWMECARKGPTSGWCAQDEPLDRLLLLAILYILSCIGYTSYRIVDEWVSMILREVLSR